MSDAPTFPALLIEAGHRLLKLSDQTTRIASVEYELTKARGAGSIRIKNEAAWEAILDARDGLLLRLVSFAKAMYSKTEKYGVRGLMHDASEREEDRERFQVGAADGGFLAKTPAHLQPYLHEHRKTAFKLCFPKKTSRPVNGVPCASDLVKLGKRFSNGADRIKKMRDMAAHPFEIVRDDFEVKFIVLVEIVTHWIDLVKAMLLLVTGDGWGLHPPRLGQPDDQVREMIDLLVFGSAAMLETDGDRLDPFQLPWMRREAMYKFLHETSARLGKETVNDSEVFGELPPRRKSSTSRLIW